MSSFNKQAKAEESDSDDEQVVQKVEEKVAEVAEDTTLANSDVCTKYQEAAKIVQACIEVVSALCVPGAKNIDLCVAGDAFINEKVAGIFRGKNKGGKAIEKGVAFPTCVSINDCVCHMSPLVSDDNTTVLAAGDMVKMDLGVHVDGYMAVGAHTVCVGYSAPENTLEDPTANVMNAAWAAARVAAKLIVPGNTNNQVTAACKKVADAYGVQAIAGTVMHQMKRYVIDGNKTVLLRGSTPEQKVETCTFERYEAYAIDVCMSTGEGNPRPGNARTTVFKRQVDQTYGLKIKGSRMFFNEVNQRFPAMPFSLRAVADERAAKIGVRECVNHNLLVPYPVLYERTGDKIAHVKFTVLLLAGGTQQVCGGVLPEAFGTGIDFATKDPEVAAWLVPNADKKKKKKAKK